MTFGQYLFCKKLTKSHFIFYATFRKYKNDQFSFDFLWIFPYNMGNNDRKGADPGMRKVDHNKQQKRESLLDSAFSLFIDNGFNKTSIADIVKNAGVAKGTFYLYFKDKYDIRNHLIAHKASQVFQTSYLALQSTQKSRILKIR